MLGVTCTRMDRNEYAAYTLNWWCLIVYKMMSFSMYVLGEYNVFWIYLLNIWLKKLKEKNTMLRVCTLSAAFIWKFMLFLIKFRTIKTFQKLCSFICKKTKTKKKPTEKNKKKSPQFNWIWVAIRMMNIICLTS